MAKTTDPMALNDAMRSLQIKPSGSPQINPMGAFAYQPQSSPKGGMSAMGSFAAPPPASLFRKSIKAHTSKQGHPPVRVSPPLYQEHIRSRFKVPFGKWTTFKWTPHSQPEPVEFNLVPNPGYRFTSPHFDKLGSLATFQSAHALRSCIEIKLNIDDTLDRRIPVMHHAAMAHAVYCSNYIEQVGAIESITWKICHRVFAGENVVATDVTVGVDNLQEHLESLVPSTKEQTIENVVLARKEIIQHAKAMAYIISTMVNEDTPLTEDLILRTHKILVTGLDIHDHEGRKTHSWSSYAGRYRRGEEHVMAGTTNFVSPPRVAKALSDLCAQFEEEVKTCETTGRIDPICLAAKYCQEFVMIHPFLDGNGRMCRLILNAILMKYMGCVVGIGGRKEERMEYLAICRRAGEEMEGAGELAGLVLGKVEEELDKMNREVDMPESE